MQLNHTKKIYEECIECALCSEECLFLRKIDRKPKEIAAHLLENLEKGKNLVFLCSLCGLCDQVCPLGLKPSEMFLECRRRSVEEGFAPFDIWTGDMLSMTDMKWNIFSLYRENYNIDYSDLIKTSSDSGFFPGCSMASFAPKLTRRTFDFLSSRIPSIGFVLDCCYKPLFDLGLHTRFEKALSGLKKKLDNMGVTRLITACPMCYYFLRTNLKNRDVVSVYHLLDEANIRGVKGLKFTVHDSCPDRKDMSIGNHIRKLLKQAQIIEMKHSKEKTVCCGAGGLTSAVDPDLCMDIVKRRLREAEETGADNMVVYCFTCANMLCSHPSRVKITHTLSKVFELEDDYSQIHVNIQKMFSGENAEENLQKLYSQIKTS